MKVCWSLGVLMALGGLGCGSDANLTAVTVTGSVVEGNLPVPAGAKVYVAWSVSATASDYIYKFGEGTAQDATFSLKLTSVPPTDALNNGEFGVGLLVYVTAQAAISDGKLADSSQLTAVQIGGAETTVLIYRKPGTTASADHWLSSFPAGFSCGLATHPPGGMGFVVFTPTPCSGVQIKSDTAPSFPNWT